MHLQKLEFTLSKPLAAPHRRFLMSRKYIDCREFPSDKNCTIAIFGTEEELLDLAVLHAVISHGHTDTHNLRQQLRSMLKDAPESKSESATA